MSNPSDEQHSEEAGEGITDDKLPDDLRPTDDNPLAKPMGDDEELVGQDDDADGTANRPDPAAEAPGDS
jgi:hypothetical protein